MRCIPKVVLVLLMAANEEAKQSCENMNVTDLAKCTCKGSRKLHITCDNLRTKIHITNSQSDVFVYCDQQLASISNLPSPQFGSVRYLPVYFCLASTISVREITDRLGVNSVERLIVEGNGQTQHPGQLANLNNVSELHLVNMGLTHIDSAWFVNENTSESTVLKLGIKNNNITELNERAFQHFTNVTEINLEENLLSELQDGLFDKNLDLTSLDLNHNRLENIHSKSLSGLTRLKSLRLSNNRLTALPDGLLDTNTNLTELFARNNRLENINSKLLFRLDRLDRLILTNNNLTALPEGLLNNNTRLVTLDLSYNRLENIPSNLLSNHDSLLLLELSNNLLTSLPEGLLDNTTALTRLYLNNNRLESLPRDLFKSLTKMEEVNLNNNRLKRVDSDFSMLPGSVSIDLSGNSLSSQEAKDLITSYSRLSQGKDGSSGLHRRRLILSNNNITSLDLSSYKTGPSNKTVVSVTLDNNPLVCDCHLHPLVQIVHNNANVYFDNAAVEFNDAKNTRCVAPAAVKDRALRELSLEELTCP